MVDFLTLATAELLWLNQREETEISRDWSARTLRIKDIEEYYEVGFCIVASGAKFHKIHTHIHVT